MGYVILGKNVDSSGRRLLSSARSEAEAKQVPRSPGSLPEPCDHLSGHHNRTEALIRPAGISQQHFPVSCETVLSGSLEISVSKLMRPSPGTVLIPDALPPGRPHHRTSARKEYETSSGQCRARPCKLLIQFRLSPASFRRSTSRLWSFCAPPASSRRLGPRN